MSGIAGIWERGSDPMRQLGILEGMISALGHRGGLGAGIAAGAWAALGHTCGDTAFPLSRPTTLAADGRVCTLVLDGRITNLPALREALGAGDRDAPPEETVLRAYLRWGEDAFRRLCGPFALAVWDSGRHTLLLARDRLGVRPLFYRDAPGFFLFASEVKGILAHPRVRPVLGGGGLSRLLAFTPARLPGSTPLEGIGEVLPGHCISVSARGIRSRCWWQLSCRPHREDSMDTARHLRALLQDAVRLAAENAPVPGCFLTGDPESMALAALLLRDGQVPYTRAAVCDAAVPPAEFLPGCRGRETAFPPEEVLGCLTEAMRLRDGPGMGESDAAFLLAARAMAADTRTALSSAGADLFTGSPTPDRAQATSAALFASLLRPALRSRIDPEACLRESLRTLLAACPEDEEDSAEETRLRRQRFLHRHLMGACRTEQADRMAVSADIRLPFCHEPLAEYLWNIPASMLQAQGREKGLLRLAMAGDLPVEVFPPAADASPPHPFSAVAAGAEARLRALCTQPDAPLWEIFDPRALSALVDSGGLPRTPAPLPAALLLQMQDWLETCRVDIRI